MTVKIIIYLRNGNITLILIHQGVYLVFTTGGKLQKTVCHINTQTVYVHNDYEHTPEQLAKSCKRTARVATGQGKVREIQGQGKIREF